ncbi:hypothetical protein I4U23_015799 [Adineta vaga]|nr:hypothetical protein I4U23_015799 [Adineta vaga]
MLRLIWIASCNSATDRSSTVDIIEIQKRLQDEIQLPLSFDDTLDCSVTLRSSLTNTEKNILIMHIDLVHDILPEVHHLCHVICIFVYFNDLENDHSEQRITYCANEYKKVIIVNQNNLVERLKTFNRRWHQNSQDSFSLCISHSEEVDHSATTINGGFVFSQLLLHSLLRMKPLPHDREEFCTQCMKIFQKNYELEKNELRFKTMLEELRKFQEDIYTDDTVLRWYTMDSFLYRIINESLRADDVGILFHSRFVIRELNEQLIKRQYKSPIRVYRGQRISNDEAELLAKSIGQLVSMKSFLSTSLDRGIAEMYANVENQTTSEDVAFVIFIIDATPSENNSEFRPFANITDISHFGTKENEILFMLGSVFRITNVERDLNHRWIVSMTACDQEDIELNRLFSVFGDGAKINGLDDDTFHNFGVLLIGMGMPYEAEKLYRHMLDEYKLFPPNDIVLARCYYMLGKAAFVAELAESTNSWWEKPANSEQSSDDYHLRSEQSKKILSGLQWAKSKFFPRSRETSAESFSNQFRQDSRFHNATKRFEQALFYINKALPFDYFLAANIYHSFANVCRALRDYKNALRNYEQALSHCKTYFGEEHRLIAEIYTDLGRMYYEKKQLNQALDYYTRGLTVAQKVLPSTHPEMGVFHTDIAVIYSELGKIEEAQFHFESIASIDLISCQNTNSPLSSYYEALYIFYSHKNTIHRTPMTQVPSTKQNSSQRTGIIFYRCPWCYSYVWIYKAFFFCKGSPCFRCLKQLFTLRPPLMNPRVMQYIKYLHHYNRFMEEKDLDYLLSRELRQQYLQLSSDKNSSLSK